VTPRYQQLADELASMIAQGALRAGDRLPSVRQTCQSRGLSAATVFQAYHQLEARGLVQAAARSGYFVSAHAGAAPSPARQAPAAQAAEAAPPTISEQIFELLQSSRERGLLPLGSAFPATELFPLERLRLALGAGMRKLEPWQISAELPLGLETLRRQIALRYLRLGLRVAPDDIVITNGALEALQLCLQTVTRPGDAVLVESPCFYAALQALDRFGLRAIEVPTDRAEGADLHAMARLIAQHRPRACWLMSSFQNPLGCTLAPDKKRALVALLEAEGVALIEDDVYAELHHGADPVLPAKAFEQRGGVLHCGSFSKCLAPGYRIGWALGGRWAPQLQRSKLMSSLSSSLPAQAALAEYLQDGSFDAHLRRLREALARQMRSMTAALARHMPAGSRVSQPAGGYFLWLELPAGCDSLALLPLAREQGFSLAPGPLFSAHGEFAACLRLNCGHPWGPDWEAAIAALGEMARAQLAQR
jgi:DNA-binding transcriptional MocR family regulator